MSSLTHYSELFYGYFHEMIHYSEFSYRELPRNAVAKDEKNADVYQPHNPKACASYKIQMFGDFPVGYRGPRCDQKDPEASWYVGCEPQTSPKG